jgi:hypothetical protein
MAVAVGVGVGVGGLWAGIFHVFFPAIASAQLARAVYGLTQAPRFRLEDDPVSGALVEIRPRNHQAEANCFLRVSGLVVRQSFSSSDET